MKNDTATRAPSHYALNVIKLSDRHPKYLRSEHALVRLYRCGPARGRAHSALNLMTLTTHYALLSPRQRRTRVLHQQNLDLFLAEAGIQEKWDEACEHKASLARRRL